MPRSESPSFAAALELFRLAIEPEPLHPDGPWLRVWMDRLPPGQQSGWKLHLSATPARYGELLARVLPVLLVHGLPFKLARDPEVLEDLNDGRYGLGQVGKAITVYPPDEAAAAALAEALANATYTLAGAPVIPGDQRFDSRAPVYFRFGPFDARFRLDAMGRKRRLVAVPGQGDFPDPADGGEAPLPAPELLPNTPLYDHLAYLRGDYLFVQMLHLSAKGAVLVALPKAAGTRKPLLVKTARAGACSDAQGRDAVWALRREHALLTRFTGQPGYPAPGELRCDGDDVAAMLRPWIPGETFWACWTQPEGATAPARRALAEVLRALLPVVRAAHAAGYVLRDCSPGNLLLTAEGPVILDVELAEPVGAMPPYRRGTPGFYDPRVDRADAVTLAADHYALLGLAWMTARGELPGWTQGGLHDAALPGAPRYRDDAFGRAFAQAWIQRGEDEGFAVAYSAVLDTVDAPQSALPTPGRDVLEVALLREIAASLQALIAHAPDPDRANVYSGAAGLIQAGLATIPGQTIDLVRAAGWDAVVDALAGGGVLAQRIPGYYFGASGIAAAIAQLGVAAGDTPALARALALLMEIDPAASAVPDLCQGLAGLLRAALEIHALTGDPRAEAMAAQALERVLALGVPGPGGGMQWLWPEGDYGTLAGQACYGYGHGVAGIVEVLFQAAQHLHRAEARDAAEAGLRTLHATALPIGEGCWWPVAADDDTCWNGWCHGTPGVLRAIAGALRYRPSVADTALAVRALRGMAAANAGNWCLCHGVVSRLDAYNAILPLLPENDAAEFLRPAKADAAILAALVAGGLQDAEARPAHDTGQAGWMTGVAGVLQTLLHSTE